MSWPVTRRHSASACNETHPSSSRGLQTLQSIHVQILHISNSTTIIMFCRDAHPSSPSLSTITAPWLHCASKAYSATPLASRFARQREKRATQDPPCRSPDVSGRFPEDQHLEADTTVESTRSLNSQRELLNVSWDCRLFLLHDHVHLFFDELGRSCDHVDRSRSFACLRVIPRDRPSGHHLTLFNTAVSSFVLHMTG